MTMSGEEPVDILLVDDRPDKLLALETILSPLKENLVRATSGKQALRLLLKRNFALVLLDVRMPDIDGFQTAELIRQNERTKGLPIIFLSAYEATNEKLDRVFSLGAVDYVRTPTAPHALLSKAAVFVDLYRKNRTLQKLLDQMREKTRQLENFCYTVAHDLRAPLRAISGFADVLREEYGNVLDEGGKDCLERIQKSGNRLDRLIQDLLGYCRIDQRHLAPEEVDLESVMRTALKHLEPEIKTAQADVIVKHPLPKLQSDRAALEDVFLHLISNALKFTRAGITPRIEIYSEQKADQVRVWIEDNGIGILPEHQQRIFEMFEKLELSRKSPGTGVGLAIVSKAIERLGG